MYKRMARPICAHPGCKKRVNWPRARYCSCQHVPLSVRQANGRKSRQAYAYKVRMQRFEREIKALRGRTITREDLLAVFKMLSNRAYQSGYTAGVKHGRDLAAQRTEAA